MADPKPIKPESDVLHDRVIEAIVHTHGLADVLGILSERDDHHGCLLQLLESDCKRVNALLCDLEAFVWKPDKKAVA